MTNQKPKIFLSYAHEDIGMAKKIYQDLKRYDLDIWFDNESLLGGQNWKFEINKAIKESTYFLAVLSKESIDGIGYVQKELKIALEMLDLYPKNKTYILPVRIEDCEPIEERLSDLHWINVFPESEYQNGLKKIMQVVSPGTFLLRSKPAELSEGDVSDFIRKFGFYDDRKNPESNGFSHEYKKINDEKIIFDGTTGLMWQQSCSNEKLNCENIDNYIAQINEISFGGVDDWRLPTLEEAMSLMEPNKNSFGLNINSIFNDKQIIIWTSDTTKGFLQLPGNGYKMRWGTLYIIGGSHPYQDRDSKAYVRAVRSAQSSQE